MPLEKVKQFIAQLVELKKEYFSRHIVKAVTGIDINADFIKFLTISQTAHPFKIEKFAVVPLPKGAIIKNEIKQPDTIATLLKQAILENNIDKETIALAVNRSAAIIKTITVDKRFNLDEIESRVWIEANRLFPNLVADIYLDFAVLGLSTQDNSQLEIILVACRKEQMRPYLTVMEKTELSPKIIDINCYAFERALSMITANYANLNTVALLNIDFSLITLIVIQEKNLIYTHELSYDGHQADGPTDPVMVNETLMASIGLHLRHSMQFFYSSKPNINIQQIILSGDCAVQAPALAEFIQKEIGIEVVLPDLFKNMVLDEKLNQEKIKYHMPQLILSCGLALSKLN